MLKLCDAQYEKKRSRWREGALLLWKKHTYCLAIPSILPLALARCSEYGDSESVRSYGGHLVSKQKASEWLAAMLTGTSRSEI